MPVRALIVDDEAHARARMRQMLAKEIDVVVTGECSSGRQALEHLKREHPDLVFLDIQMPAMSGLEVCQTLAESRQPMPLVIFVTAFDQFAINAFEVHAIDYLLKPFDRERLQKALQHARSQLLQRSKDQVSANLAALLQEFRPSARKADRIVFKENGRLLFVRTENIDWIEADGNYVRVHAGHEKHYFRETLTGLEAQFPPNKFIRISRSTLVNVDRIKEMQPLFYGDYTVLLQDGSRLNMTRAYRDRLQELLGGS
jgi:two-component system, LytTR family, response regulator